MNCIINCQAHIYNIFYLQFLSIYSLVIHLCDNNFMIIFYLKRIEI